MGMDVADTATTSPERVRTTLAIASTAKGDVLDAIVLGTDERFQWPKSDETTTIQPPETKLTDITTVFKVL